jgi:hypothetical protein
MEIFDGGQRPVFNNTCLPPEGEVCPRGFTCPPGVKFVHILGGMFTATFTPECEHSLLFRKTEGQTEGPHP